MLIKTTRERYSALEQALRAATLMNSRRSLRSQSSAACRPTWTGSPPRPELETHRSLAACTGARRSGGGAAQARRRRGQSARTRESVSLLGARPRRLERRSDLRHRRRLLHVPRALQIRRRRQPGGASRARPSFRAALRTRTSSSARLRCIARTCGSASRSKASGRFDLKVISQGCADAGVCYVPMESGASLQLAAAGAEERPSVSQAPPWVDPVRGSRSLRAISTSSACSRATSRWCSAAFSCSGCCSRLRLAYCR